MGRAPKAKPEPEALSDSVTSATIHEIRPRTSEQDREANYLRTLDDLRGLNAAVVVAEAPHKAAKLKVKERRALAEAAGFSLAHIDLVFKREAMNRKAAQKDEQERQWHLETAGQVIAVQQDLLDRMPEAARDEQFWRDHGRAQGLANKPAKPPAEMSPVFTQAWLQDWGVGKDRFDWSLAEKNINPERSRTDIGVSAPQLGPEEPDEEDDGDKPTEEFGVQVADETETELV